MILDRYGFIHYSQLPTLRAGGSVELDFIAIPDPVSGTGQARFCIRAYERFKSTLDSGARTLIRDWPE